MMINKRKGKMLQTKYLQKMDITEQTRIVPGKINGNKKEKVHKKRPGFPGTGRDPRFPSLWAIKK